MPTARRLFRNGGAGLRAGRSTGGLFERSCTMSRLHRFQLNLEPLEDRRLLTELLSLKLFLSTTPAAALAQVASATTASLTPGGAQLQGQLQAALASQAVAPAQEAPGLTSASAQLTRQLQVGHASLSAR